MPLLSFLIYFFILYYLHILRYNMHLKLCLWQLMEYSYLLDQADECEDPYMVLVYACKYSLTLSWWHSYQWNFSIEMN